MRSLNNIAESEFNTTLRLLPLDLQAAQREPLEINIEIQQAMRDNNINIGDPDYNHNIDILLGSIIDRANLRRSTTSSTTTNHQPLHLHRSGSASASTTYLPQQQETIGIIGTIYSLDPAHPLSTTYTSSTTSSFQRQLPPEHQHLQPHRNICMINNIESQEDEHREEFDNNSYILQSMRIIHDNNNMEAWTGTIINHDNFSSSLRVFDNYNFILRATNPTSTSTTSDQTSRSSCSSSTTTSSASRRQTCNRRSSTASLLKEHSSSTSNLTTSISMTTSQQTSSTLHTLTSSSNIIYNNVFQFNFDKHYYIINLNIVWIIIAIIIANNNFLIIYLASEKKTTINNKKINKKTTTASAKKTAKSSTKTTSLRSSNHNLYTSTSIIKNFFTAITIFNNNLQKH